MNTNNEQQSIEVSELARAFSEFYPGTEYGAVSMADMEAEIFDFADDGDDALQELDFIESTLVGYRRSNEVC